jgi:hypothetical protein
VTFTNTGTLALSIRSLAVSNGWTQSNNCLPSVPPNASCVINVSFQPTSSGPLTGALSFTDYAVNSPQTVTLSGTGFAPVVSLSPTSLTFAGQSVSTTSATQSITLTNTGNGPLTNLTINASGDFAQTNNCGGSVAASGSCTINVTFTPTTDGTRTGALTLADNASGSPQRANLRGTGGGGAKASLSASSLTFSGQSVSTTGASQSITLTNTGTESLTSLTIAASGDFAQTNNCAGSVATSASCNINVTFTPTANGSRTGALTLTDNAADSPQRVSLSGTGGGGTAWLVTSSLAFSSQLVGTSSPQVTLQVIANQTLNITSISIAGANSGDFRLAQNCGNSLAANATCQISLTFTPTAPGARNATVSIVDDAANSPQTISLSGTGIGPAASLSPH